MISRFFTTPITITTPSEAGADTNADSEGVPTTATVTTTVKGHAQPYIRREGERVTVAVEEGVAVRTVWLPLGTAITARSRLTIHGDLYEVADGPDDWQVGSRNDHLEVIARRIIR